MFKWPGTPSPKASTHELADYTELVCWKQGNTSTTNLSADLSRLEENHYPDGVLEEDESSGVVEEAYQEIEQRRKACRDGYPFALDEQGYSLSTNQASGSDKHIIYKYLLLATRLNMKDNGVHAGIDGALLFEKLAAEASRKYLGARAESFVFGTDAGTADFPGKVDALCGKIREGKGFENRGNAPQNQKDGKLDVVVWLDFADGRPGKLIAFGQCKTGTYYKDTLTQLHPDAFCKKWLKAPLILTPVRMFFVAEALSLSLWHNASCDAGLLFDRCRIVDFCDDISSEVLEEVTTWTRAAARAEGLPC